ncbi:MAG: O-antigen ligase family protein [Candidatus Buchananbacteria bacterium]
MTKIEKLIEFGFYLFIFLLPWQTRLIWQEAYLNGFVWEYGRASLYGTELFLWLVLWFYGFWVFAGRHLKRINFRQILNRLKKPPVLIYWLVILFLLLAGLSVVWSLNSQLAYWRWFTLIEGVTLFSLISVFDFKLEKIAKSWVASAAIQGVFGIWQFFSQYVFPNKWLGLAEHLPNVGGSIILQTDSERWLRAYGSFPHPNILGGFLAIGLLFLFYLAFIAQKSRQRFFVLAGLVCIAPALFFSFSRSAWLALIFSLIALGLVIYQKRDLVLKKIFLKISLLIFIIFAVLGTIFWAPLITRISGEQDLEVASIYLRVAFTQQAWQLISANPWQGTGIGNYTLGVFEKINAGWPGYYYQPVHNIYFLVLAELGIFGALVFGLMLVLLVYQLVKHAGASRPARLGEAGDSRRPLRIIIVLLCLFLVLFISLVDHYFWTLWTGVMIFWIILGLNLKQLERK